MPERLAIHRTATIDDQVTPIIYKTDKKLLSSLSRTCEPPSPEDPWQVHDRVIEDPTQVQGPKKGFEVRCKVAWC